MDTTHKTAIIIQFKRVPLFALVLDFFVFHLILFFFHMSNIKVITQAPVAFQFWLRFSIHVLERSTLGRDVCECGVPSHVKLTQQLAENWA